MPARKSTLSADALRDALLDAAGRLLTDEGPHALSTRRLTEAVGTSTQSIYTLFGGKEGLIRAMYREGFTRLSARMLDVPTTDDVLADLRGLGYAYRAAAHAGPHFYAVMFGHPVAEFTPDADDRLYALATHQLLADAVQRAIDAGFVHGDGFDIGFHLWVCVHGFVSLELAGALVEGPDMVAARYDRLLADSLLPYLEP